MKITILGIGDAFSAKHYSSCFVVEQDDCRLLVDCPHPIRKILREGAGLDIFDINAVVLTHLHADHASGLEDFAFFSRIVQKKPMVLISHEDVVSMLEEQSVAMKKLLQGPTAGDLHLNFIDNVYFEPGFDYFFKAIEIKEHQNYIEVIDEETPTTLEVNEQYKMEYGPFELECHRTIHHIPTFAWKISAGGKTLAYSADTTYDMGLIEWLDTNSDMVIHESNLGPHTHHEQLTQLDEKIREKMHLIHCPDDFESSVFPVLREGETFTL